MAEHPAVSVVIPVYNDPSGIRATLTSVTDQTHDQYEVIVVDNGSTDETRSVARRVRDRHPQLVRLVEERRIQTSYAARNTGIDAANGELIAFLDADETVDRTWIDTVVRHAADSGDDYFGCAVVDGPRRPTTAVGKYNRYAEHTVRQYLAEFRFAPTCCLVVRREVFETVGRFDERLYSSGDKEFGRRVHEAGFRQGFAPEATIYHPARSPLALWRKHVRVGRGLEQLRQRYPRRFGGRNDATADRARGWPPRDPRRSIRSVRSSLGVPVRPRDLLVFFLLERLTALARTFGSVYERLFGPDWTAVSTDVRRPERDDPHE